MHSHGRLDYRTAYVWCFFQARGHEGEEDYVSIYLGTVHQPQKFEESDIYGSWNLTMMLPTAVFLTVSTRLRQWEMCSLRKIEGVHHVMLIGRNTSGTSPATTSTCNGACIQHKATFSSDFNPFVIDPNLQPPPHPEVEFKCRRTTANLRVANSRP